MSLPTNTTDRLLALANLIEDTPDLWEQDQWVGDGVTDDPAEWIGKRHVCDTAGCIAGNAVMLTPLDQYNGFVGMCWSDAGKLALSLESDLRADLFDGDLEMTGPDMAVVLRAIASLPEGGRTLIGVRNLIEPGLYGQLIQDAGEPDEGEWDDGWDDDE